MRLFLLLCIILLLSNVSAYRSRRLRRQSIPSQHIQVHSLDSNVMLTDFITVESTDNRVDMYEKNLNGSIWSDHSVLLFDTYDTFVNTSADRAESFFNIQNCALVHSQGDKSEFYMRTNRTQDGNSALTHNLFGNTNFSIEDSGLRVQAVSGNRVGIEAQTWETPVEKKMVLNAETLPSLVRELRLEAFAPPYHMIVCFEGAMIYIQFADKIIKIEPTYKIIEIFTDKYTVMVKTNDSPYDVTLTNDEVNINLPSEKTNVCVHQNGVSVHALQQAKTQVDRNGGSMEIGGHAVNADGVKITSLSTNMELSNAGQVNSDTVNSNMVVHSNVQQVGLTAKHHNLKILGGVPHIVVEPGQSCVEITANHGMPTFQNLLPPFTAPVDKFINVGPFTGNNGASLAVIAPSPVAPVLLAPPPFPHDEGLHVGPPTAFDLPQPTAQNTFPAPQPGTPPTLEGPPALPDLGGPPPMPEEAAPLPTAPKLPIALPPGLGGFAADLAPIKPQKKNNDSSIDKQQTNATNVLKPLLKHNLTTNKKEGSINKLHTEDSTITKVEDKNTTDLTETSHNKAEVATPKMETEPQNLRKKLQGDVETKTVNETLIDETLRILQAKAEAKKRQEKLLNSPDFAKLAGMAADLQQPPRQASTTTTVKPTTTTELPTTITITTTTSTTPATTTTTTQPTTTTTLSPSDELKRLKEEMKKMKEMREWDETHVSNDRDGDEHVEAFTYPNGTTVQRVIKTRRRITTTVIHHHKEEVDVNNSTGTVKLSNAPIVLTTIAPHGPPVSLSHEDHIPTIAPLRKRNRTSTTKESSKDSFA